MKAKELAEQLMKNPDFDVKMRTFDSEKGMRPMLKTYSDVEVFDIGYSDRVLLVGGTKE
jgi:hypothetical protein